MPPRKPLHQRLRDLIPESVKERIPESVKERIRPPAWREPPAEAPAAAPPAQGPLEDPQPESRVPEWAMGASGRPDPDLIMWIPGTRAFLWGQTPNGSVTVHEDSKERPLPAPLTLPYGTDGWIVRVGPDWVAFRVGENVAGAGAAGAIFKVMKTDLFPTAPSLKRDWEKRDAWRLAGRSLVVGAGDLDGDGLVWGRTAARRKRREKRRRIVRSTWYLTPSGVAYSAAFAQAPGTREVTLRPDAKVLRVSEATLSRRTAGSEGADAALIEALKSQAEAIKALSVLIGQLLAANSGGYDAIQTEDRMVVLNPRALEAQPARKRWLEAA